MTEKIIEYLALFLAILIAMPAHEFAHAFIAHKSGDYTPKQNGRLTLNPFAHFDVLGLVMLIVARFGWAKPVPINPYNFKHIRRDYFFVAIAGVTMNLILAFLGYPLIYAVGLLFSAVSPTTTFALLAMQLLYYWVLILYSLNLNLVVFNLIPIYPLDGFRVVEVIFAKKPNSKFVAFLRNYGQIILLLLLLIHWLTDFIPYLMYIDIFGFLMSTLTYLIGMPISLFWNMIFGLFA